MSRGLGALQRRILETLDEAKATALPFPGSGHTWPGVPPGRDPAGWVCYGKGCMLLAPEAYDLRCSSAYLYAQCVLRGGNPGSVNAAFPRAVKHLVQRGFLTPLFLVPLAAVYRLPRPLAGHVHRLADGLFLDLRAPRQIRFVSRQPLW